MPLGISESTIKAAYGPLDLSGVYKGLQSAINKLAAEEKAYRLENLKEYTQMSSKLTDASKGARSADIPEIMNATEEWRKYTKIKDSDPNMIQNDPKKWAEYQNKADEAFSKASTLAKESAEFAKEYNDFGSKIVTNAHLYKDEAAPMWATVKNMPLSEIKDKKLNDYNIYVSETPDYQKMVESYDKKATPIKEKLGTEETKGVGLEKMYRQIKYKNIPEYSSYVTEAGNTISSFGKTPKRTTSYAEQVLQNANDYENVVNTFNKNIQTGSPSILKEMHISKDMPKDLYLSGDINQEVAKKTASVTAAQYMAMKKFNQDFNQISTEDPGFKIKDEVQKMKLGKQMSFDSSMQMWRQKLKETGLGTPESFDVSTRFNAISEGGEKGQSEIKSLIEALNSTPIIDPNATMITTGKGATGEKADKYKNYSNSNKVLNALKNTQPKTNLKDDSSVAEAMNQQNLTSGLINVNVNPASVRTGKVLAFSWYDDKSGVTKTAFLDAQDKESANQLNKLVKSKIQSRKEKSLSAIEISGGGEGILNSIK